jgi:hypothetical protein
VLHRYRCLYLYLVKYHLAGSFSVHWQSCCRVRFIPSRIWYTVNNLPFHSSSHSCILLPPFALAIYCAWQSSLRSHRLLSSPMPVAHSRKLSVNITEGTPEPTLTGGGLLCRCLNRSVRRRLVLREYSLIWASELVGSWYLFIIWLSSYIMS